MFSPWIFGLWGFFMLLAIPYSAQARNPYRTLVGAYITFTLLFSLIAFILYGALFMTFVIAGNTETLGNNIQAMALFAICAGPAFFAARYQIQKEPADMG